MDNTETIAELEDALTSARNLLDRFDEAQDEHSDEGNEEKISAARAALDDFEGAIGDLVP